MRLHGARSAPSAPPPHCMQYLASLTKPGTARGRRYIPSLTIRNLLSHHAYRLPCEPTDHVHTTQSPARWIRRGSAIQKAVPEHRDPRRRLADGGPSAVTFLSPTPSTHLEHKGPTSANGIDLDHVDSKRRFRLPVPGGAQRRSEDEHRPVLGAVGPVLKCLRLAHPKTVSDTGGGVFGRDVPRT